MRVCATFTGLPLPDAHWRHALLPLPPDEPMRRASGHQRPSRHLDHVGRPAVERGRRRPAKQCDRRGPADDLHRRATRRAWLARPEQRPERRQRQRQWQ